MKRQHSLYVAPAATLAAAAVFAGPALKRA